MSEQQERLRSADEIFEELLEHSYKMKDERDGLRQEYMEAQMREMTKFMATLNGEPPSKARRAALRRRKALAYIIAITSFPVAVAGLYAVGEYGVYGLLWFVLSGLCLLVAQWVDKG